MEDDGFNTVHPSMDGRSPSGRATAAEPSVSALRDGIPNAVRGAMRQATGLRDILAGHNIGAFIEALHERGIALVEMNRKPSVQIATKPVEICNRAVRARVSIEAGVLGGEHIFPEHFWLNRNFREDHLPRLLARTITSVLEQQITERIAQGMEAEGGDSEAGSVHDSPTPQGDAPDTAHNQEAG